MPKGLARWLNPRNVVRTIKQKRSKPFPREDNAMHVASTSTPKALVGLGGMVLELWDFERKE